MLNTMKVKTILLCLSCVNISVIAAEEITVKPQIESVGLFKNGIAVVRASFPVTSAGTYRWDKVPQVIHGTFWVESDGEVAVQSTMRKMEEIDENGAPTGEIQQDLAGKEVSVKLRQSLAGLTNAATEVIGTVWRIPQRSIAQQWNTDYASLSNPNRYYYGWNAQNQISLQQPVNRIGNFLVLEEPTGTRRYIDLSGVSSIQAKGPFGATKRMVDKPVLVFDVRKPPTTGGVVRVSWLTKGMAWMPSYMVDLSDAKKLRIRQNALVRNESEALSNTEVQLISGFPSVEFGAVDSLMGPGTSLATFFQQINQSADGSSNRNTIGQQVYMNSYTGNNTPMPELKEQGEGSNDIHYESIGNQTLKTGDSLSVDVAAATSNYERVVEWIVPDERDEYGRYRRNSNDPQPDVMAWDAVRFTNPFKFPMTSAAALISENGKFRGQTKTQWVNPGQSCCMRITLALSVQTEFSELEEEGKRDIVYIGSNDYRRTIVKSRLLIKNYRGNEITMAIRREFSGKLVEADADPESKLRAQGVYSVNPRRQLDWNLKIPAGEEKELTFRYEVLVDH